MYHDYFHKVDLLLYRIKTKLGEKQGLSKKDEEIDEKIEDILNGMTK